MAIGMIIEMALGIVLCAVLLLLSPFASMGLLVIVPVIVGVYILERWPSLGWLMVGGFSLAVFYEAGRHWSEKRREKDRTKAGNFYIGLGDPFDDDRRLVHVLPPALRPAPAGAAKKPTLLKSALAALARVLIHNHKPTGG
jgi:hypothetical protein